MDFIINLNKPKDITSQDAVSKIKKILGEKKAGHCGTLDPFATGVLLICTGKATRLAAYFSGLDKEYIAEMKLGESTDTQDLTGKVIKKTDRIDITEADIRDAVRSFEGLILQKPPMFSALKHKGKPLYKLARKGIDIPREPREVYTYKIDILEINLPFVTLRVRCSKGTYIRTLCNDIGDKLGIGAHLFQLDRVAVGHFRIDDSLLIDEVDRESMGETRGVYSMDSALSWMPDIMVNKSSVKKVKNGNQITIEDCINFPANLKAADNIKVKSPQGEFLAVGSLSERYKDTVKMDVVFA
ncbi:MAG: tRNA pseudouridine(55) synthase TruB [Nitrospirae bacterium]|nr:tRNA pseudouridine(55) synthase TruB [Nitrospirota bacterium]